MIGSTFLCTGNEAQLSTLADDLDMLDDFTHVSLEELGTLDFETVCSSSSIRWSSPQPVIYDEENGLAIFKVQPEGIEHVLCNRERFSTAQHSDLKLLADFVAENGIDSIYELATF